MITNLQLTEAKDSVVSCRSADKFPLEERNVEDGRVVVDKLQQVELHDERVVELNLCAMHLRLGQDPCHFLENLEKI